MRRATTMRKVMTRYILFGAGKYLVSFGIATALVLSAEVSSGQAVTEGGGISLEMLSEIQKGYSGTIEQKAVRNALSTNSIPTLSVNSENLSMIDTHFSDVVPTKGITNQKSSGRCWLFSGLNVLRAGMINRYGLKELEFSQNYLFFYDQLEKSNLFLQAIIDTKDRSLDDREVDWLLMHPLSDGGQFTGVSNLVMKYGVVPSSVMPETYQSNNTAEMSRIIKTKLREYALKLRETPLKNCQKVKTGMLSEVYSILAKCLGVPPAEFSWTSRTSRGEILGEGKVFTPKSFYDEFIGVNLNEDYVMLMNDPSREYGKVYEIQYDRHVYDGHNWLYVNLPVEDIKKMAVSSIKDSVAMYFSCDVRKFMDKTKGTLDLNNTDEASLFSTDFPMDKKQRIQTHASGSSHAMTLIAVDVDKNTGNTTKWMVENSWGNSGYRGNLIMTDKWFDEYMFRLVVNKKYVPSQVLRMLDQKPVQLPAWDPMFLGDE